MIHCIGDSHVSVFTYPHKAWPTWYEAEAKSLPQVVSGDKRFGVYYIGPATAYNIDKRRGLIDIIINRFVRKSDRIMFIVGEIDCRAHVVKQSRIQNKSIEDIACGVANKAFAFINSYSKYHPIAWGPCYSHSKTKEDDNSTVPFSPVGSAQERNMATDCYNKRLKQLANTSGIPFLSVCGHKDLIYYDDIHLDKISASVIIDQLGALGL